MARLIDVGPGLAGSGPLIVRVGDVLAFAASGGRVAAGAPVLERLGPLIAAVVTPDGRVLSPEGPPGTVLFVAHAPGRATIDVMSGDPWHGAVTTTYTVDVEPESDPVLPPG